MFTGRQRVAVCLLAALSITMLLHVHAALDAQSVHCNVCIQQSHGIVEHTVAVVQDEQVRFFAQSSRATAPDLVVSLHVGSRAPPA